MTQIRSNIKEVIDGNKDRNYQVNKLKDRIKECIKSISLLHDSIQQGFLYEDHELILQKWLVRYKQDQDQMETHLTEMLDHVK